MRTDDKAASSPATTAASAGAQMVITPRAWLVLRYIALIGLALLFMLPFYVIVRNAFSTNSNITSARWNWLPDQLDLTNVDLLLAKDSFGIVRAMFNSAVMAVLQTAGTVVVSLLAGYALARYTHRLSRLLLALTIFTLMVPATMTFVPIFLITAQLGWIDTFRGLVIPGLFSAFFSTYLFRQFFLDFPVELEDASLIDGCNQWSSFWRIVVPNSKGIISAVGTIVLIGSWNSFLWPSLVGRDATRTVQVALSQFMTSQGASVTRSCSWARSWQSCRRWSRSCSCSATSSAV